MMRSLWAGVSGLQNHQTRMDVLGNNIANVNTNGFKKGRVTFQDMLSQTLVGRGEAHRRGGRRESPAGRPGHAGVHDRHDPHPGRPAVHGRDDRRGPPGQRLLRPERRRQALLHPQRRLRPRPGRAAGEPRRRHARAGLDGADRRRPDLREQRGGHPGPRDPRGEQGSRRRRPPTCGSPATWTSGRPRSRRMPPPRPSRKAPGRRRSTSSIRSAARTSCR